MLLLSILIACSQLREALYLLHLDYLGIKSDAPNPCDAGVLWLLLLHPCMRLILRLKSPPRFIRNRSFPSRSVDGSDCFYLLLLKLTRIWRCSGFSSHDSINKVIALSAHSQVTLLISRGFRLPSSGLPLLLDRLLHLVLLICQDQVRRPILQR